MKSEFLTVGIDAGETTGLALYDARQNKIIQTHSTDFFGCFKFVRTLDKEKANIVVEVPPAFIYQRNYSQKGAFLISAFKRQKNAPKKCLKSHTFLGF